MAFNLPRFIAAASGRDDTGAYADWNERVVTAVAVSMALLIVATVAVLMGMA
jgi:hypothetical protein